MEALLEYPDVTMEVNGTMADGRLKLTDEKIVFKLKTGNEMNETTTQLQIKSSTKFIQLIMYFVIIARLLYTTTLKYRIKV